MLYKFFFKRTLDIFFSITALIALSPLMLTIITIVFFEFKGSIFFIQERAGKNGKSFKMIKFRTMIEDFKQKGLTEENAISGLGNFLRKTSLDEIPEFLNILIGNMSIIGPRPLLLKYVPLYNNEHKKRLDVKPGLTGLAQVSGRNGLSWSQRFDLDIKYVNSLSMKEDIKIFIRTFYVVLSSTNIKSSNNEHMSEFIGYEDER